MMQAAGPVRRETRKLDHRTFERLGRGHP
jgi:hypothetical protein